MGRAVSTALVCSGDAFQTGTDEKVRQDDSTPSTFDDELVQAKKAFSSGIVEGLNRKINLVTRKAYGYRSYDVLKIALFHTLGDLPEPELTHSFC